MAPADAVPAHAIDEATQADSAEDRREASAGLEEEELAGESRKLLHTGRRLATTWLDSRKAAVAQKLHDTSEGLRKFGATFEEEPNIREYIEAAADGLDDASLEIDRHDIEDLVRSAEDASRQQPLAVFGGAMVAGLLLSRLLRSTSSEYAGAEGDTGS
jgi:hypothetical protein